MEKCDLNCFECPFSDCINDNEITRSEIIQSEKLDSIIRKEERPKEHPAWWNKNLTSAEKARMRYALDAGYRERKKTSSQKARKPKQKVWIIKPVKWETKYGLDYIRTQREKRLKI